MRSIERADVVILVLDCTEGIVAQDMRVLQEVLDNHRSVVVVVNKWDTIPPRVSQSAQSTFFKLVEDRLSYFPAVQIEFMSGMCVPFPGIRTLILLFLRACMRVRVSRRA
jgi:GTPase